MLECLCYDRGCCVPHLHDAQRSIDSVSVSLRVRSLCDGRVCNRVYNQMVCCVIVHLHNAQGSIDGYPKELGLIEEDMIRDNNTQSPIYILRRHCGSSSCGRGGDSCRTTHSTPLTARGRGLSAIRTTCDGGLFKQPLAVFFQRLAAVVHTLHS